MAGASPSSPSSAPAPRIFGDVQPSERATNGDSAQLSHSTNRLSLNSAAKTPPPSSPAMLSHPRASDQFRVASSPARHSSPNGPSRSPSAVNVDLRSSSPGLARKKSTSSLRGGETPTPPRKPVPRRSSSSLVPSSPTAGSSKVPLAATVEEGPSLTAATVASEYLRRDIASHNAPGMSVDAIVVLHDSCYGHRYSRPKTKNSTLSMIVERPERIEASILGVSAAYVRLGERHTGGQNAPHPERDPSGKLPFKIRKTLRSVDITSPVVTNVHGTGWMQELRGMCDSAASKLASTGKELSRSYENPGQPDQPAKAKLHEGDLYLCPESLAAFQGALGAVCDGVDAVFEGSRTGQGPFRAFVCIRPPGHHCSSDYPSGFCWLNNVHVGIEHAAQGHGLTHAAIIDFDLHHGDGSQAIAWDHNAKVGKLPRNTPNSKKTAIGYFSLHDINSYPCEDGDIEKVQNASLCIENAHGQSIWNVHLQPWKTEEEFWHLYETRYSVLIHKARAFLQTHTERLRTLPNYPQPTAAIFLSAGFDASEWESQGMQRHKVNVPSEFYARITRDIVRLSQEECTGVEGRVISTLEGGYSDRALISGVLSHLSGLCEPADPAVLKQATANDDELGVETLQRLDHLDLNEGSVPKDPAPRTTYNSEWWHSSSLTSLETLVNSTTVPAPMKKPRSTSNTPSNYFTPTQSFTAKAVDPSKLYRTASGTFRQASPNTIRAPTPPPPEVDWATATHELSKLLIPTDRQTKSCKPEELAEPRVKKERQSTTALPSDSAATSGRQLRDRKVKSANYTDPTLEETVPALNTSKANRRKTIADLSLISDITGEVLGQARPSHSRRRSSAASSIGSVSTIAPSAVVATKTVKSLTVKPVVSGLHVKKTRVVSDVRHGNGEQYAIQQPLAAPVPSTYASKPKTTRQSPRKERPTTSTEYSDMDQLTSGIKRINLKVPPRDEYEARQAQKVTDEAKKKKAGVKTAARKPPASRASKTAGNGTAKSAPAKESKGIAEPSKRTQFPIVSKIEEPSVLAVPEVPMPSQEGSSCVLPRSQQLHGGAPDSALGRLDNILDPAADPSSSTNLSALPLSRPFHPPVTDVPDPLTISPYGYTFAQNPPAIPSQLISQASQASDHSSAQCLSGQQTTQVAQKHDQPSQQRAPHTDSDVAGGSILPLTKQMGQLPVFTANGVIPFGSGAVFPTAVAPGTTVADGRENAAPSPNGEVVPATRKDAKDIWEVPETPQR